MSLPTRLTDNQLAILRYFTDAEARSTGGKPAERAAAAAWTAGAQAAEDLHRGAEGIHQTASSLVRRGYLLRSRARRGRGYTIGVAYRVTAAGRAYVEESTR